MKLIDSTRTREPAAVRTGLSYARRKGVPHRPQAVAVAMLGAPQDEHGRLNRYDGAVASTGVASGASRSRRAEPVGPTWLARSSSP